MQNITLPAVNKAYYSTIEIKRLLEALNENYQLYKKEIDEVSLITKVDKRIINTVITLESMWKQVKSKAGAIGLMQIKTQTANDAIYLENKKGRLGAKEKEIIISQIGLDRFSGIIKMKYLGHKIKENNNKGNVITEQDLYNTKFNILCGALMLGILIDECTIGNIIAIDKVFLRYNKGYFFKPKGATVLERMAMLNTKSEAYTYVLKTVGINGILTETT